MNRRPGQSEAFGALIVDGEEIRTTGAPNLVFGTSPEPFDATEPAEGRDPVNSGEIAVSATSPTNTGSRWATGSSSRPRRARRT